METHCLSEKDFSEFFGIQQGDLPEQCRDEIASNDFKYQLLEPDESSQVVLHILKEINSGRFSMSNDRRRTQWNSGWQENLDEFVKTNETTALDPKYYRGSEYIRLRKQYVKCVNKKMDYAFFKVLRMWIFLHFLKDYSNIYEFGCGPAHNLVVLGDLYPEKHLYGLDWAESSIQIIKELNRDYHYNIEGFNFDFFNPDRQIDIQPNSVFVTFGGLEQIGTKYEAFIQFILEKRPDRVVNVEPIIELYDESSLVDPLVA